MNPRISVIMAVYNNAGFLRRAIESIQKQSVEDWELIVVDDASSDGSLDLVNEMAARDIRIRSLRLEENSGAGVARDFGIQQAKGKYIAIFDADDISMPNRFELQLGFLEENSGVVGVGTQTVLIDESGRPAGKKTFPTDPDKLHRMMYTAIPIQLPTLMVDTTRLPDDFSWFEGWRYSEDTLLFFKLAHYGKIANLPDSLLEYRYYSGSTSYKKAKTYFYKTWKARGIARHEYGYQPSFRSRITSGMQFLVVTCLPGSFIPSIYKPIRRLMLLLSGHDEK